MDIIARLSKSQRLAYDYMQGVVARGIGATESLKAYRSMGETIRTSSYYELFNYVSGSKEAGYAVNNVRSEYYPDVIRIPLARTNIRNNFSYNVRIDMYNSGNDERFSKNITITSSENMRIIDIKLAAESAMADIQSTIEGSDSDIENIVVESALRKSSSFTDIEE